MTKLSTLIGNRPPTINDWLLLADAWCLTSDYTLQDIAPAGVVCKTCWDTRLCAECLGEYPNQCPVCDGTGWCHCQYDHV
jgi:hypothetical protein